VRQTGYKILKECIVFDENLRKENKNIVEYRKQILSEIIKTLEMLKNEYFYLK